MSRPSLCLLVTTTPQERPLRGLCSAGPTAARLLSQAASRPRVSQGTANQRLPGITPASPRHTPHAQPRVLAQGPSAATPTPTPAQLRFPGRHSLGAQAQSRPAHSPPESHAQLPLLTGPCHRFLEPRLPGMWDCHAAPCPPAWHLGAQSRVAPVPGDRLLPAAGQARAAVTGGPPSPLRPGHRWPQSSLRSRCVRLEEPPCSSVAGESEASEQHWLCLPARGGTRARKSCRMPAPSHQPKDGLGGARLRPRGTGKAAASDGGDVGLGVWLSPLPDPRVCPGQPLPSSAGRRPRVRVAPQLPLCRVLGQAPASQAVLCTRGQKHWHRPPCPGDRGRAPTASLRSLTERKLTPPGPAWEDARSEPVCWTHPSLVLYPESLGFLQMCSRVSEAPRS